jgi:hypothetical protein
MKGRYYDEREVYWATVAAPATQHPPPRFNAIIDSIESSCFAQTFTLVAVLSPIIKNHVPQTTGVPIGPAE